MNEAEVTASERPTSKRPPKRSSPAKSSKSQPNPDLKAQVPFPGIESVMHGNGAVAQNDCQFQLGDDRCHRNVRCLHGPHP